MNRFSLQSWKSFCWRGSILMLMPIFCAVTFGQPATNEELAEGPFQQKSEAMRDLIHLQLNKNLLVLRRDWRSVLKNGGMGDRRNVLRNEMMERGFDFVKADLLAEQMLQKSGDATPLTDVFFKLSQGSGSKSSGRSVAGGRSHFHFSTSELSGRAELADGRILLSFSENDEPSREFSVKDDLDGLFEFQYSGNGFLVQLKQKNEGNIRIVRIRGDQTEVFSAQNFAALRNQEPELIDQWLLPLFEHLGFALPLEADDSIVQQAVLRHLIAATAFSTQDFKKLVADLDADEFSVRNMASETLQTRRELYAEAIRQELDSASLSPEARARLASILNEAAAEDQVNAFIREQELLQSTEFLIGLLAIADVRQEQAVFKQLQVLTGENLSDRKSWEQWLSKPKQNR